jgi:hypothetical protein
VGLRYPFDPFFESHLTALFQEGLRLLEPRLSDLCLRLLKAFLSLCIEAALCRAFHAASSCLRLASCIPLICATLALPAGLKARALLEGVAIVIANAIVTIPTALTITFFIRLLL